MVSGSLEAIWSFSGTWLSGVSALAAAAATRSGCDVGQGAFGHGDDDTSGDRAPEPRARPAREDPKTPRHGIKGLPPHRDDDDDVWRDREPEPMAQVVRRDPRAVGHRLDYVRQIRAKEIDIYFGNLPLLIDLGCANPREMIDRERKISLLATTTISCDRPDAFPTRQMTLNVDDATHAADVELIDSLPVRALDQFRDHVYSPARELDERTAREMEASMKNGILTNRQNEAYHRTARDFQRQTKAAQKEKELREQLKTAKVSAGGSSTKRGQNTNASRSVIVSASSTRRVKTVPAIAASPSAILSIDDLNDSLLQPDIAPLPDLAPLDAMPAVQDASQWQMSDWEREFAALAEPSFSEPAFWAPYEPTMSSLYETAPYIPNYLGAGDLNGSVAAETSAHMVLYPDMPMFSGSDPTTLDELLSLNSSLLGASIDGPSGSFGDSLGGGDNIQNQLPALRAPPSPSESGSPAHAVPTIPQKRCRDQVDESNIISSIRVRTRSAKLQQSKVDPAPKKRPKYSKAHGSGYIVIKHL
ncbi:hypothetical protein K438DRAFT_1774150 [Mycena galopus ATCC 62051]|nr:hypothetical protein K438DRAFT_1774150 [Mycena galopus ATCC 62051]